MQDLIPDGRYQLVTACPRHQPWLEGGLFPLDCASCIIEEIVMDSSEDLSEPPD